MRSSKNTWYIYRHVRLDNNEPFYIGIGCKVNYERAYSTKVRNKHWKNIVTNSGYDIDILMDGLTKEQAIEKEKEFIKLYGRRDLKTGTLCNLTDGGEGTSGCPVSKEAKEKLRAISIGRKNSLEARAKMSEAKKGSKCYIYGKSHSPETIEKIRASNIRTKALKRQAQNELL